MTGLERTHSLANRSRKRAWLILTLSLLFLAGCREATPDRPAMPSSPATAGPAAGASPTTSITLPLILDTIETTTPHPGFTEIVTPLPSATGTPGPVKTPTLGVPPPVLFAAIGDFGLAGQAEADVAALIDRWQVDFVITLGDNNYPSGAPETIDHNVGQYYHAYISPYTGEYGEGAAINRFFPSLGNHDWLSAGAQPYLDYFTLPGNERYYSFTWGPVELFALDSNESEPDGFRRDSAQAAWLQGALAASQAPWKIVYFHHAPYTSGSYHGPSVWMQWPFEEWGASAVLAGHEHIYERLQIGGIPYFVNGIGGGAIYEFGKPLPGSLARYNQDYGAMWVQAVPDAITFQFFNRKGELIDSLVVQK